MAESITIEDILAAQSQACKTRSGGGGMTVAEIAAKTGRCDQTIRRELGLAIQAGTVQCVREQRPAIDGVMRNVPAYRALQPAKPKGKR